MGNHEVSVKVIADSIRPDCYLEWQNKCTPGIYQDLPGRIITIVMRYARWIHAEFMTHRDRARNAASSRAISVSKGLMNCTFRPIDIPSEQRGMQGGDKLSEDAKNIVYADIDEMCEFTLSNLTKWIDLGVHKSIINRYLEPFSHIEVVCTATRWDHFLGLRHHPDAEPHFQQLAAMVRDSLNKSVPRATFYHRPFITVEDIGDGNALMVGDVNGVDSLLTHDETFKVSAARAAGISYRRPDLTLEKELKICEDLITKRHSSPLEHPATCSGVDRNYRSGPMVGWKTLRTMLQQD